MLYKQSQTKTNKMEQQNLSLLVVDSNELHALSKECSYNLQMAVAASKEVVSALDKTLSTEDEDSFMHLATNADSMANEYLVKCRDLYNSINECRTPFTKRFDEIKKYFTGVENMLVGKSDGEMLTIMNKRQSVVNRVASITEARRRKADLDLKTEQEKEAILTSMKLFADFYIVKYFNSIKNTFMSIVSAGHDFETSLKLSKTNTGFNYFYESINFPHIYVSEDYLREACTEWYDSFGADYISNEIADFGEIFMLELSELFYQYQSAKEDEAALLAMKAEMDAKAALEAKELADKALAEQEEAKALAELTVSVDNTPDVDFGGSISTSVDVKVTSSLGYASLFAAWFKDAGSKMDVEKLSNFKLSSLTVWAKKHFKDTGIKVESDGLVYFEAAKTQVRKK